MHLQYAREIYGEDLMTGRLVPEEVHFQDPEEGRAEFPADFQLVAAMNPCRCGYANDPQRACAECSPAHAARYQRRVSGPLRDRIDLQIAKADLEIVARQHGLTQATRYVTDLDLTGGAEIERELFVRHDAVCVLPYDPQRDEVVLVEQKYVKDPDMTVEDYVKSVIGKLGENMQIKRFARFQIGG